ncbi:barstar family protein [Tsukamurella sp. 1534]|uniref:barstar family protein n=1 Tax=Tsukamurella sp. 1534 TaxID=1151061 RepID=UPI0002E30F7A|nr:barstar family protein [Tsukamurella sp. 1534]
MKTFTVDGRRVADKESFYAELGRAVNGPGGYFGGNLDALVDCLRGGFGTPEDEPFDFRLTHAADVRTALGPKLYAEIVDVFSASGVPLRT